jgi:hypothetical protein
MTQNNAIKNIEQLTKLRILKITAILLRQNLKLVNNVENNKIYEEISTDKNLKEELIEFMHIVQELNDVEFLDLLTEIEELVEKKTKVKPVDSKSAN